MGCDIHSMVEVKWLHDDKWGAVTDALWVYPYFDKGKPVSIFNTPYITQPFSSRNYWLFSVLANVRNYNLFEPIAESLGMPDDASPEWTREVEAWGNDFHSHSYLTYEQLKSWADAHLDMSVSITKAEVTETTRKKMESDVAQVILAALEPITASLTRDARLDPPQFRFVFAFDN